MLLGAVDVRITDISRGDSPRESDLNGSSLIEVNDGYVVLALQLVEFGDKPLVDNPRFLHPFIVLRIIEEDIKCKLEGPCIFASEEFRQFSKDYLFGHQDTPH